MQTCLNVGAYVEPDASQAANYWHWWNVLRFRPASYSHYRFTNPQKGIFERACAKFDLIFEYSAKDAATAHNTRLFMKRIKDSTYEIWYDIGIKDQVDAFLKEIDAFGCHFAQWWYSDSTGSFDSALLPIAGADPVDAFYPWLPVGLKQFGHQFKHSKASVLILIGEPGTGKTTFIRGLVRDLKCETWVTYDPKVQEAEKFYTDFLIPDNSKSNGDDVRVLVLEDADSMIGSRTDGNKIMNRLLNISDGLVAFPQRKFIISTNLPGLKDMDKALLRPGRCEAILNFRKLTKAEAIKACEAIGREYKGPDKATEITLSEAINGPVEMTDSPMGSIGFV